MCRGTIGALAALGVALAPACSDQTLVVVSDEAPDIEVEPALLDFGSLGPGETATRTTTIKNVGDAALRLDALQLSEGSAPFTIDTPFEAGTLLEPEANVEVQVTLAAPLSGDNAGTLEVHSNSPSEGRVDVSLVGAGLVPQLQITPTPWDFGELGVGCSTTEVFTVTNVGTVALTVSEWSFDVDPPGSALVADGGQLEAGLVLDPGQSTTVQIWFYPDALTSYSGTLSVSSADPMPLHAEGIQYGLGIPAGWNTDSFAQEGNNLTDILWVVDNSCSMDQEQTSLATNFATFMSIVSSMDLDYNMAVITTDEASFRSSGGVKVLTPTTPDVAGRFSEMVQVGTNGDSSEKGLKFSYDALQPSMLSGTNAGFLREEAGLRIIYVSDERDSSPQDWSVYYNYFTGLKPGHPEYVIASAVIGVNATATAAAGCTGAGGSADAGIGYFDIANYTSGVIASICASDWSSTLSSLAWISLSLADRFALSAEPVPSTITVAVDGVSVSTGWTYDATTNEVVFEATSVPDNGSTVDITYALPGDCTG